LPYSGSSFPYPSPEGIGMFPLSKISNATSGIPCARARALIHSSRVLPDIAISSVIADSTSGDNAGC